MASQHLIADGLQSLVSGLGTDRDKASSLTYINPVQDDAQIIAAYRSAWLPRKIIDQPAEDATRKWREWQADASQISALEATEKRLDVRAKVETALRLAGLFGTAHIYIGTDDVDLSQPLRADRIRRGGIRFLNVLDKRYISGGEVNNDSMSDGFGKPLYYNAQNGAQVHPSRLVTFYGAVRPDGWIYGWEADSELLSVMDAVKRYDGTVHNVAALVHEARLDVITIPDLAKLLSDPETERQLISRFALMRAAAGNYGTVLLNGASSPEDVGETWEQKNFNFATLPDIIEKAQEEAAAASRIPRAVLFGTGAGGLGATGDLELSAYYDRIHSKQANEIEPAMALLDECIIRDALGARPADVWYSWRSLWQMSDKDQAEINQKNTAAISQFITALSQAPEYMVSSMVNKVTEDKLLPGLEGDFAEWIAGGNDPRGDDADLEVDEPQDNQDDNHEDAQ